MCKNQFLKKIFNNIMNDYKNKYLKYKKKYLNLKKMQGGSRLCSKYTKIKDDIYELLGLLEEKCNSEELPSHVQDYNRDLYEEDLDPTFDELWEFESPQKKIAILMEYLEKHGNTGNYYNVVNNELSKLGVERTP